MFMHDFFVLNAADGSRFVSDPTGYQFGFEKFLFTYTEYESTCLDPGSSPVPGDNESDYYTLCNSHSHLYTRKKHYKARRTMASLQLREELQEKTKEQLKAGIVW